MLKVLKNTFFRLGSQGTLVSLAVLFSLALFIVPIHSSFLDIFLVVNLTIAIALLVRSLLVSDPIRLFSFPSILLLSTLFRLALNVSSTRLILLYGDRGLSAAGEVIRSFGSFVIQGDFIVGVVIFSLISVVNFLVIAKGSARVAEVAARFVLDAMPGKQLAIDADLRSGIITAKEAELKREDLSRVSQFYGAMDGAMKFVQGDAIAGLVITAINAIGGISIGVSRGLSFSDAVTTFGILTIGDGLVSIIPALLISVCAGVVITHVSGENKKGSSAAIFLQITEEPLALVIAASSLIVLGVMPSFPFWPFFLIGASILLIFYFSKRSSKNQIYYLPKDELISVESTNNQQLSLIEDRTLKILNLAIPTSLYKKDFSDTSSVQYQKFHNFYKLCSRDVYKNYGLSLPNLSLSFKNLSNENSFSVSIREESVFEGELFKNQLFVALGHSQLAPFNIEIFSKEMHPLTGQMSCWIEDSEVNQELLRELEAKFYTDLEFVILKIVALTLDSSDLIYGIDEIKALVVASLREFPALKEEIFDKELISYAECSDCIKKLILERVNVRDIKLILETMSDYCSRYEISDGRSEWLQELYEFVRERIQRISNTRTSSKEIFAFKVTDPVIESFRSAISLWDFGRGFPPLRDNEREKLKRKVEELLSPISERGIDKCFVICESDIRYGLQAYLRTFFPQYKQLRVLSNQEVRFLDSLYVIGAI